MLHFIVCFYVAYYVFVLGCVLRTGFVWCFFRMYFFSCWIVFACVSYSVLYFSHFVFPTVLYFLYSALNSTHVFLECHTVLFITRCVFFFCVWIIFAPFVLLFSFVFFSVLPFYFARLSFRIVYFFLYCVCFSNGVFFSCRIVFRGVFSISILYGFVCVANPIS